MTTQTKHTPLPYSISGIPGDGHLMAKIGHSKRSVAIVIGWNGINPEEYEANKAFIQTACNTHYQLVHALQAMIEDTPYAYDQAKAALALAEKGME